MSFYLTQGLHRSLRLHPDRVALVCGSRRRTFRELVERVARLAGALRQLGVRPGDRIALLGLNSDRYIESILGGFWAGAAVCPINSRWNAAEVQRVLNDCGASIVLLDDSFLAMAPSLSTGCPQLVHLVQMGEKPAPPGLLSFEALIASAASVEDARRGADDLAFLLYTGGTTGFPKGVMISHTNLASASLAMSAMGCGSGAVMLHVVPSFHMAGVQMMFNHLFGGGTHVTVPGFEPVAVCSAIAAEQVSDLMLVPTMMQMLFEHPAAGSYDLSSVRRIFYGGAPITHTVLSRAMAALPHVEFIQGYGMTETCLTVMLPGASQARNERDDELHPAGIPLPLADVRIVDAEDREVERGVAGEIVVRGPMVMRGYWNHPELTAEALRSGWMHTGDVGIMDADGFVFIVDRLKDMIISGGENVYSTEVENALAQHPAVALSAVIGIPHEKWGESVHAVVVLKEGTAVSEQDLIDHCRGLIAGYKCPRSIEFRGSLPLSATGKLLKNELRAPYWKQSSMESRLSLLEERR